MAFENAECGRISKQGLDMKKTLLTAVSLLAFTVACGQKETPKGQDSEGNCKTAFVESYNKVQGSGFDVQQSQASDKKDGADNVLAESCKTILKTYGNNSQPCRATDLKTGNEAFLSTKGLQDICSKSIKSDYFGANTKE
jgi:hypothetical protein